jgi:hypothetical protein
MNDENKDRLAVVALADVMSRLFTRPRAMSTTSPADSTPRLEGASMTDPITVTLSDGRVLAFVDSDYTREDFGTRLDPPTPAEVTVRAAWWLAPDGTETELTADELNDLHNGPEYDAFLTVCQDRYWSDLAADMGDYDDKDEP